MDRQHPRDLFDVYELFAHEGITPGIRRAFVVYLACHNRPVHEVLFPVERDVTHEFEHTFVGMTTVPVGLDELLTARARMIGELQGTLDTDERRFLVSLVSNTPDWSLLNIPRVHELPGIRWKLRNLVRLESVNPEKFAEQCDTLTRLLGA